MFSDGEDGFFLDCLDANGNSVLGHFGPDGLDIRMPDGRDQDIGLEAMAMAVANI